MSTLPGVKVGPMDPEATSSFGQVNRQFSARTLIRLHSRMYPPHLVQALARKLDPELTKALDMDEVRDYLAGQELENGDPLVPEGYRVVAAAVRGERDSTQVLTFIYQSENGRQGKWYAPYSADELPESSKLGQEYARVQSLKDRGVVAFDEGGAQSELLRRQVSAQQREIDALREQLAGVNVAPGEVGDAPASSAGDDPPYASFEDETANDVVKHLRDDSTSNPEVEAILAYERTHANRKTVIAAGEDVLGRTG